MSVRRFDDDTAELCEELNARAAELAPELLPNGRRAGNKWMFSGIADHGKSESAWVHLSGPQIGHWKDMGNAAAGEERGDMVDLLRIIRCHGNAREAFAEARRILGRPAPWDTNAPKLTDAEKRERAAAAQKRAEDREREFEAERKKKAGRARWLFRDAPPIASTPAEEYLHGRQIEQGPLGCWPGSLRYRDAVWHEPSQQKYPALIACSCTPGGEHIGTHRIFLARNAAGQWGGIPIPPELPKKERRGYRKRLLGNLQYGFIPINKGKSGKSMAHMPEGERVYVTEGLEDALVVRMVKPEARIICGINLWNMGEIILPPQAGPLVVVADRDTDDDGEPRLEGVESVIARQQSRGVAAEWVMPPEGFKDINDWLRGEKA